MTIANLTLNEPTPAQKEAGVVNVPDQYIDKLHQLLTFDDQPDGGVLWVRAMRIAVIALETGSKAAMMDGAPYLMAPLERALINNDISPLYEFSKRETDDADGETISKHIGFVNAQF